MHIYPVSKKGKISIPQILDKECTEGGFEESNIPIISFFSQDMPRKTYSQLGFNIQNNGNINKSKFVCFKF